MKTAFVVSLVFLTLNVNFLDIQREWFLILVRGPLGIWGPILMLLLCLWAGRGERSPWYVKVILVVLVIILMLVMLGLI